MTNVYELDARTIHPSTDGRLADLAGRVTLIVNVASECGYTPQYSGLQALHAELEGRGFSVAAFPCNQFGAQEPGDSAQIAEFCSSRFDVTFPVFEKADVKGDDRSPVWAAVEEKLGAVPGWNFCKVLVGREGNVIGFYESGVAPDDAQLREDLEAALG